MKKEFFGVILIFVLSLNLVSSLNVTLKSPSDSFEGVLQAPTEEISFSCSAEGENLSKISLYGDWHDSGWGIIRYQVNVENNVNVVLKDILGFGEYLWNCEACDNESNCVFAVKNYTLNLVTEEGTIFWRKTYVVSNFDFKNGITKKFLDAFRYRILINETYYFIGVKKVNDNNIEMNISNVGNYEMVPGDAKNFDVSGDGVEDITLYLDAIINRAAYLTIRQLDYNLTLNKTNISEGELDSLEENLNSSLEQDIDSENISNEIENFNEGVLEEKSSFLWWILGFLVFITLGVGIFFYLSSLRPSNSGKGIANNQQMNSDIPKFNYREEKNNSDKKSKYSGKGKKLPDL